MARMLYLHPGLVPPPADPRYDKFFYASEVLEGEVVTPVWWATEEQAKERAGDRFPVSMAGRFRHHMLLFGIDRGRFQSVEKFVMFVRKGLELHREEKFDVIMTYGTNTPGMAGVVLKLLTGAKLVPELPNVPHHQYRYTEPHFNLIARVKKWLSDVMLHVVLGFSDAVKLLYPTQLDHYPLLRNRRIVVFHDLVAVSRIAATLPETSPEDTRTILLVGHPWFTKGVDVAIRGFRRIAADFPDYRLVIVGHIEDPDRLGKLAAGCDQIELRKPVQPQEALRLISSCSVYLSASRTEGIARVLLEAMSASRPIVASAVGGTPHLIPDNECGLLFRPEDPDHLAAQLSRILRDRELASRLGKAAAERVKSEFDEEAYVRGFHRLVGSLNGQTG